MGARGVTNLASKLLLALLPPNQPFFRLHLDEEVLTELIQGDPEGKAQIEKQLAKVERSVVSFIDTSNTRTQAFETLRHLVALGNGLVHLPREGGMRLYRIDQYAVRRDMMGNPLEIVVKEQVSPLTLPDEVLAACQVKKEDDVTKNVEIYTHIRRKDNKWKINQEINEIPVPGSAGTYPLDKPAWIPLRWSAVPGEDYGRGLVEENLGDFRSLEALSKAIVKGSAAAAKVLFLVDPNGTTKVKVLTESESGDVKSGRADDVSVLQMDKFADFRVAFQTIEMITQRLSHSFLLNSAVQRNAERVTAAEVRFMAQELEDALGGVYSVLSQEFQLPLVKRVMVQMQAQNVLPQYPDKAIKPAIVTGLQALGRGHDLDKLNMYLQHMAQLGEGFLQRLNMENYSNRVASAVGVDTDGLLISEEQFAQQQNQAQMQQMMQQAGPGVAQELIKQNGGNNGQR